MFSKEEKIEWIRKQIKTIDHTQEDLEKNNVGTFKTLEIEKEILEEWLALKEFLKACNEDKNEPEKEKD